MFFAGALSLFASTFLLPSAIFRLRHPGRQPSSERILFTDRIMTRSGQRGREVPLRAPIFGMFVGGLFLVAGNAFIVRSLI